MKVYFIAAPELGKVKIGIAQKPTLRFSKIQSDNPCQLVLLAMEDGGRAREIELHKRFATDHVRGEWFVLSTEIQMHIDSLPAFVRTKRTAELTEFAAAAGISKSYASLILSGKRRAPTETLLKIYRRTGRKIGRLAIITDSQADSLATALLKDAA